MSATGIAMIFETALLAVVVLFVVALLRSHAEILRRLDAVETQPQGAPAAGSPAPPVPAAPPGAALDTAVARAVIGETLNGDAVKLAFGGGAPRTLLAFLSSGCGTCAPLWSALRRGAEVPLQARLIIVTKGRERESVTRLRELEPPDHELVMSTAAWEDFSVLATPHFVLIDGGTGRIAGRGSAISWEQISTLVHDAYGDGSRQPAQARSSSARAARAEAALAAAGISAGHPTLHPSQNRPAGERE